MDYSSDLDIVVVFDGESPSPVNGLTHTEAYVRFVELFVAALSSVTREGYLYRVDLRLRPDGQKGPLASSAQPFTSYVEKRAGIWEWLAYVKLRAVAGDIDFGRAIESQVRSRIHELGRRTDANQQHAVGTGARVIFERARQVDRDFAWMQPSCEEPGKAALHKLLDALFNPCKSITVHKAHYSPSARPADSFVGKWQGKR